MKFRVTKRVGTTRRSLLEKFHSKPSTSYGSAADWLVRTSGVNYFQCSYQALGISLS